MELKGAVVGVTGATGFLGRYIVDDLVARGAKVVGIVRNPDRVKELRDRIELRKADLAHLEDLTDAFAGLDALVSNAALFSVNNQNWQQHMQTNVEGTRNVFLAAAELGIKRAVQVSSVAVYDRGLAGMFGAPIDENSPQFTQRTRPGMTNAYAVSKALSEQEAWRICREHSIGLTAVRPSIIYGAHDPNFTSIIRRLLGWPLAPVPTRLGLPLVYAGDVAKAVGNAFEADASQDKAYNTAGENDRTVGDFVAACRKLMSRKTISFPLLPIPIAMHVRSDLAKSELAFENRSFESGIEDMLARDPSALG